MAQCDEGYRCAVCGEDVPTLHESSLYLRYLLGEVPLDRLHLLPEAHVRCLLERAQYVIDPAFPRQVCEGIFDKRALDAEFVRAEEARVTAAWRQLQQLAFDGEAALFAKSSPPA